MSRRIVSFGGGVNSGALLVGLKEHGIIPDAILFADTGAEKPETYAFVDTMRTWAVRNLDLGIEVVINDGQYIELENECIKRHTLPALVFGWRSCSDKYKVRPQKKYAKRRFPGEEITWIVGIDAGEKRRMGAFEGCWHPLIEWGWDREACRAALRREGLPIPVKSACFFCPASTKRDVFALSKDHPELFARAVAMEENAEELRVKGLGRHWSWKELVQIESNQAHLLPEAPQIPCVCFDGEE